MNCVASCELRLGLCSAREALGPIAAERTVVNQAAQAFHSGAVTEAAEAKRKMEITALTRDFEADPVLGTDPAMDLDLAIATVNFGLALVARSESVDEIMDTDPGLVQTAHSGVDVNIATLDKLCTKGPNRKGACRAPRSYRKLAEWALGFGRQQIERYRPNPDPRA